MRLQQFHILLAIAEAGSIRGAAKALKRTQPSLTKAIRLLEQELSAPILKRTARGVQLTEYGSAALKRARSITAEVARLQDEIAQLRGGTGGSVRIGVSPLVAATMLPQAIAAFRKTYSDVDLTIIDTLYPDALPLVREGHIDFTVGPLPPGIGKREFEVVELLTTGVVVVAAKSNPKVQARSLNDLLTVPWVVFGPSQGPGALFTDAFKGNKLTPPKAATTSTSLLATLSLVEATDAFCVMPERLISTLQRQYRIAVVPVREKLPDLRIAMLSRADMPLTPAAEALATAIRKRARASISATR